MRINVWLILDCKDISKMERLIIWTTKYRNACNNLHDTWHCITMHGILLHLLSYVTVAISNVTCTSDAVILKDCGAQWRLLLLGDFSYVDDGALLKGSMEYYHCLSPFKVTLGLRPSCACLYIGQRFFSTRICPVPAHPPCPMIIPGLASRS